METHSGLEDDGDIEVKFIETLEDFISLYEKAYKCFADLYNGYPRDFVIIPADCGNMILFLKNFNFELAIMIKTLGFEDNELFDFLNTRYIFGQTISTEKFDKVFKGE